MSIAIDQAEWQHPQIESVDADGALKREDRAKRLHLVEMRTARAIATVDSTTEHDRVDLRRLSLEVLRTPFAGRLRVLFCASGLSAAQAAVAMNVTTNHLAAMKAGRAAIELHQIFGLLREPRARPLTVEMVEDVAERFRAAAAELDARSSRRATK